MSFFVVLPMPPSANNLTRNIARGRVATAAYVDWKSRCLPALLELRADGHAIKDHTFRVELIANLGRTRDLDNIIKPIIDIMVSYSLTPDDRWCDEILAVRLSNVQIGHVGVKVDAVDLIKKNPRRKSNVG